VGDVDLVDPVVFFEAFGMAINDLSLDATLTTRDGGDDADFVPVFERRFLVLKEADVFFIHIDVYKAADFAFFIHKTFLDAGKAGLQLSNGLADGG
jgi:hypothetical protein